MRWRQNLLLFPLHLSLSVCLTISISKCILPSVCVCLRRNIGSTFVCTHFFVHNSSFFLYSLFARLWLDFIISYALNVVHSNNFELWLKWQRERKMDCCLLLIYILLLLLTIVIPSVPIGMGQDFHLLLYQHTGLFSYIL